METCHICSDLIKNYIDERRVFFNACCARSLVVENGMSKPRSIVHNACKLSPLTTPDWCPKLRGVLRTIDVSETKLLPPPQNEEKTNDLVEFNKLTYYGKRDRLSKLPRRTEWADIEVGGIYVIPKILTNKMKIVKVLDKTETSARCREMDADLSETVYATSLFPRDVESIFITKLLKF